MDKQTKTKDGLNTMVARLNQINSSVRVSALGVALFTLVMVLLVLGEAWMEGRVAEGWMIVYGVVLLLIAFSLLMGVQVARQWEKAVVLRLGKFKGLKGPGVFMLLPIIDSASSWIDHRVMVTPFSAEKTLTRDTVPVDVDAVLFWVVWDAEKAALEVEDYRTAIAWAAQTALREVIGQKALAEILIGRAMMDAELQRIIDERTTPWGITVQSVEIRDVIIPQDLEDSMSRQAQAERERQPCSRRRLRRCRTRHDRRRPRLSSL